MNFTNLYTVPLIVCNFCSQYNKLMNKLGTKSENLVFIFSENRLNAYKFSPNDDYSVLLERYSYNIKISQAFYPVLSILEIALRNKINAAIEQTLKPDWLLEEINKQDILRDKEYKILIVAKNKLEKSNKSITKGHLISELSFGFWVHLCTKTYKTRLWHTKNFFRTVFKNYPDMKQFDKMSYIYPVLKQALEIRNRIFHHEIIINNQTGIENIYNQMKELLFYIDEESVEYLNTICNFEKIQKQSPGNST